jgi:hypothetical protein
MAAAAITPRLSDTAFNPSSLPGVSFVDIVFSPAPCRFCAIDRRRWIGPGAAHVGLLPGIAAELRSLQF